MNYDSITNGTEGRALALAQEDQRGPEQSGESASHFSEKTKARFWSKVKIAGPDECWEWIALRDRKGYGEIYAGGKTRRAHRVSWMLANGEIPAGICVCHRCDNPPCINPAHLFLGTVAENNADMKRKARARGALGGENGTHLHPERIPRGAARASAKLTGPKVIEIRALRAAGVAQRTVAAMFGVGQTTISGITLLKTWKHVLADH